MKTGGKRKPGNLAGSIFLNNKIRILNDSKDLYIIK